MVKKTKQKHILDTVICQIELVIYTQRIELSLSPTNLACFNLLAVIKLSK